MIFVWNLQISVFEAIKLYGESVYVSHVIYYRARSIKNCPGHRPQKINA